MNKPQTIHEKFQYLFLTITWYLSIVILFITLLCYVIVLRKSGKEEGVSLNNKNKSILSLNLDTLYNSFRFQFGTTKFLTNFSNMVQETVSVYQANYSFQDELSVFCQSNPILASAIILDIKHNQCYARYSDSITVPPEAILSQEDLAKIDGLTWLPSRKAPLPYGENVLCLVIPFACETYLQIAETAQTADALLIAFIKESYLESIISPVSEGAVGHTFFLFTEQGELLKGIGSAANKKTVIAKVRAHREMERYEDFISITCSNHIPVRKLYVIDYTDNVLKFFSFFGSASLIYFGTLIAVCIMIVMSKRFIKKSITDPIKTMIAGVDYIKNGDFSHTIAVTEQNELGILANQINDMSIQITRQMDSIREKEELQYQILKTMGCDVIQGYYFSRPVPPEEFEKFIEEEKGKRG